MPALLTLAGLAMSCGDGVRRQMPPYVQPTVITVSDISPSTGSTAGSARVVVTGSGFMVGVKVTIGGTAVPGVPDSRNGDGTRLYFDSPAHAPGIVDVIIGNIDGGSITVPNGYTFVPPDSLDFNGSWWGYGNAGQDRPITFTIEHDTIRSVACDQDVTLTFPTPLPITNGEFSFVREDGVSVRGRIASANYAVGTINLAPCSDTVWTAGRVGKQDPNP
ncbi:MAG TPA: IPT/TIG domain-containing protein [Vicinamibacterales bacterium]|nr:IPT/TIG domain-containing protein [Vicinamibacterales bacterium]